MEEDKIGEAVVLVEEACLVAKVGPQAIIPMNYETILQIIMFISRGPAPDSVALYFFSTQPAEQTVRGDG